MFGWSTKCGCEWKNEEIGWDGEEVHIKVRDTGAKLSRVRLYAGQVFSSQFMVVLLCFRIASSSASATISSHDWTSSTIPVGICSSDHIIFTDIRLCTPLLYSGEVSNPAQFSMLGC